MASVMRARPNREPGTFAQIGSDEERGDARQAVVSGHWRAWPVPRPGSRYLRVPGLVFAMHWQRVLQASKADDLHQSWRRRHQVQRGPRLSGVPAHPRERSQAAGVAKGQAGHVQQDLSAVGIGDAAHVIAGVVCLSVIELAGECDRGLPGPADAAAQRPVPRLATV